MDHVIKVAFVFVIFLYVWLYQVQNQEWDITRTLLKDANNFATHDAALQVDDTLKAEGIIHIDPVRSREVFEETLKMNLGLDDALKPKVGSRLRYPVEIVEYIIFDDTNSTFPFLYDNPTYKITKYVQGPSVLAVIRSKHPEIIQRSFIQAPIQVPSIHEYKENRL